MQEFAVQEGMGISTCYRSSFESYAKNGVALYFPDDGHWNAAAQRVVALALARMTKPEPNEGSHR